MNGCSRRSVGGDGCVRYGAVGGILGCVDGCGCEWGVRPMGVWV